MAGVRVTMEDSHHRRSAGAHHLATWLQSTSTTRLQLANELGVDPTSVGNWLSGRGRPSVANAAAVESKTGIPCAQWATPDP